MKKIKSIKLSLGRKETKLFFTFFFVYAFFVRWYGWNEQSHFSLLRSIVEEKRFEIDSFYNQTGDRAVYNGHYYTDKTPGLSFLASPIYSAWYHAYNLFPEKFTEEPGSKEFISQSVGDVYIVTPVDPGFFTLTSMILVTVFTSSLFSSLTALLVYKISRCFVSDEKYPTVVAIAYAFGTIAFVNALHFMSHAAGTFLAFLSFFLLFKSRIEPKAKKSLLLAGILMGFAVTVEYSVLLIAIVSSIYALATSREKSLFFFLMLLVGILPLFLYNFFVLNNPFDLPSSHIDRRIYRTAYPETGFFSFKNIDEREKFVKNSFLPMEDLLKHFHLKLNPNPYVILRLLIYPYRGLFFYSPALLLSLVGIPFMWRKCKEEITLILSTLFLFLFFLSMRSNWWGGYCFGSRYLMPLVPFLTLPMSFALERVGPKLTLSIILLSILINSLGLQPAEDLMYDWNGMRIKPQYSRKINSFQVLLNPIADHYLPNFLAHGPRSWIFENLVNGHFSIDIRVNPISKGSNFPFSGIHVPFLCLIPVFSLILLIWKREFFTR